VTVAWRALRSVEWLVGAASESVARPFVAPGRRGRVAAAANGVWIHAASLGESAAVTPLVCEIERCAPGVPVYATATTTSGLGRLRAALGEARAGLAPLDAPKAAERFLGALRPRLALLVETELWPRWLEALERREVPVAVVSARLSERSVRGYERLGAGFRRLIGTIARVEAQSEEDAARWRRVGVAADRLGVAGNLKVDAIVLAPADRAQARVRLGLDPARPLLVLGSVRPGEAGILARAWRSIAPTTRVEWQVALIPRHPRALRALEAELRGEGQGWTLSSGAAPQGDWRLDPRLGVLGGYYAAADVAFVGGSLVDYGGHNPLEPAAAGVPVIMGPFARSQAPAAGALAAAGALTVVRGESALGEALGGLLSDPAARARRGDAARDAVRALQGAARRTVESLVAHGLLEAKE
jgi:3-deoxy-D-manno-octulosonic-acid transferase